MITYMNLPYRKSKYQKILIIRQGAIGDVVHTSNIFRSIKNYNPGAKIDYLTGKIPAQLLENDSRLNNVYKLEGKNYAYLTKLGLELRKEKYDLIINLQPSLRFRYLAFLIGAKSQVLYKKTFRFHAVENFFETAKKKIKELENPQNLELEIPQEVIDKVKADFSFDKKIVILNTQTSVTRHGRKWPKEYYKELALDLIDQYDCLIVISGSKEDIEEVKFFENLHQDIVVTAGKYSILESAALFSLANIVVSSDTGPLHIATAVKKPFCIGLYGAASAGRTGPWGMNHFAISADLDCIPCDRRKCKLKEYRGKDINPCLMAIKPEHIMRVIKDNDLLV